MGQQGQHNIEAAFALACVVLLNWVLAHLATSWVMPSEVQSAVQTIVSITTSYFVSWRAARNELESKLALARIAAAQPPGTAATLAAL